MFETDCHCDLEDCEDELSTPSSTSTQHVFLRLRDTVPGAKGDPQEKRHCDL